MATTYGSQFSCQPVIYLMEAVVSWVVKMSVFTMKNMERVRRGTEVRGLIGARWINIHSQGAGASVREHGVLKSMHATSKPQQTNCKAQQQVL